MVKQLGVDVLAGNSLLARSDVTFRPSKKQNIIVGASISKLRLRRVQGWCRRTQAFLLRNPRKTVILAWDYLELHTSYDVITDALWALEPRLDSRNPERAWPPPQDPLCQWSSARRQWYRCPYIGQQWRTHLPCTSDNLSLWRCRSRRLLTSNAAVFGEQHIVLHGGPSTLKHAWPWWCQVGSARELHTDFDDMFDTKSSLYNGASG